MSSIPGTGWHSSPIDWCERNYHVTNLIAEFFNTISNFALLALALLYKQVLYRNNRLSGYIGDWTLSLLWGVFSMIWISSAYFHATLSLLGQILDELSILWMMAAAWYLLFPHCWILKVMTVGKYHAMIIGITITLTLLSLAHPIINAFVLLAGTFPIYEWGIRGTKFDSSGTLRPLGLRAARTFICGFALWTIDRVACGMLLKIDFLYLHAIWHLLSGLGSALAVTVGIGIKMSIDHPQVAFKLNYWPFKSNKLFSIAYIEVCN